MKSTSTIRHGELCKLLEVRPRQLSFVLEEGYLPTGVTRKPSTGNHRDFDPAQAFWLAIALAVKQFGVKTKLAAQIADYATRNLRGVTQNASWDFGFAPHMGRFDTQHQYLIDVADRKWIRLVTDANPSEEGLRPGPWQPVTGKGVVPENLRPQVTLQLDLVQIAAGLKRPEVWSAAAVH